MSNWDRKDVWRKRGKDFLIEVSRHESVPSTIDIDRDEGVHRWAVYAYIYPKHPHFAAFDGDQMWQEAATALPLHGGPSLLRWHSDKDGTPTSVQVGADYNHLHDARFTHHASESDARVQFDDADKLFDWLQSRAEVAA